MKRLLFLLFLITLAAHADYFYPRYTPYYGGMMGGGDENTILSFNSDPQENLNTSFRIAARKGMVKELAGLLQEGAQINSTSESGQTALIFAARGCSTEAVKFLLDVKDVNVNAVDKFGRTALMYAAKGTCLPVVDLLVKVPGLDVKKKDNGGYRAADYAGFSYQIVDLIRSASRTKIKPRG